MKIVRRPLFFGPKRRSLFGWFHEPPDAVRRDLAIVLCPPLGHEYVNSHRPMRHLADRLAEGGIPVLRFDYDGTGNSAGGDEDESRVVAWTQSVAEAIAELRELTDGSRIGLLGVRLGATLAVAAAAKLEVDCLMAWAPCTSGRLYAREMKALHLTGAKSNDGTAAGQIEPGGFLMTEETQREIGCIDLKSLSPKTKRALSLTRDDAGADTRLREKWTAAGIPTEQRAVPGFAELFLPPHLAATPDRAVEMTVDWIRRDTEKLQRPVSSRSTRSEQQIGETRESVVHADGVFGILTEPLAPSSRETPTILLPNAGSAHHVGPNRLHVLLARRLASAGFRCVRFDLRGLGDSFVDQPAKENAPYLRTSSDVVAGVIAELRRSRDSRSFILMGLCSGAHTSFHAVLDLSDAPIVESILINPLTFYYTDGMPLDLVQTAGDDRWQRGLDSMPRLQRWAKVLRRHIGIAFYRLRGIRPTTAVGIWKKVRQSDRVPPRGDLERDLRRIIESRRKLTFVFSRFDPGYDLLMINAAPTVKKLQKKKQIDLWQIEGANHTFEVKHSRDIMFESLVTHLVKRYSATEVPRTHHGKLTSPAHEDFSMNRHLVTHGREQSRG
jgi:pimeloyl-ACP methyl ester carboxylesterase